MSRVLLDLILPKIEDSVMEFNEIQLTLLQKAIVKFGIKTKSIYERSKFQHTLQIMQRELDLLEQEKEFLMSEEQIRSLIRDKIAKDTG